MEKLSIKKDWHKFFFKNSFYNPASPEAVKRAEKEVNFILKKSKIKKGRRFWIFAADREGIRSFLPKKDLK